jgi:predicted permease
MPQLRRDGATLPMMADLDKRGSYTPRRVRERRAYQLLMAGAVLGTIGVVGLVLAVLGAIGAGWPIIALIVAVMCAVMFRRMVGR